MFGWVFEIFFEAVWAHIQFTSFLGYFEDNLCSKKLLRSTFLAINLLTKSIFKQGGFGALSGAFFFFY